MNWLYRLMLKYWPHLDIYQDVKCDVCQVPSFEWPEEWSHCPFCLNGVKRQLYLRCFYIWRARWAAKFGLNTGSIYLHHFLRSDADPDPHDHSWWFCSFLLKGTYIDEIWGWPFLESLTPYPVKFDFRKRFSFKKNPPTHIHRVLLEEEKPCWTLMVTGRVTRDFYFYTRDGAVVWWKYLGFKEKP